MSWFFFGGGEGGGRGGRIKTPTEQAFCDCDYCRGWGGLGWDSDRGGDDQGKGKSIARVGITKTDERNDQMVVCSC